MASNFSGSQLSEEILNAAENNDLRSAQSMSFLVMRAFTKDVLLNCLGLALAVAAESQHRSNFMRAKHFLEEEQAISAVRDDMHRLLLNTFPAPIVRAIASDC